MKPFKLSPKLFLVAVPAALLLGGGVVVAQAATGPAPASSPATQTGKEAPEPAGEASDKDDPTDAAGGGHEDAGDQADHQFEGQE